MPFASRTRVGRSVLPALLAALLVLAATAVAQDDSPAEDPPQDQAAMPASFTVTAYDEGQEYWFEVEGLEGRNPPIRLEPGASYTVRFINEGPSIHNVHFGGPVEAATELLEEGEEETLEFTVPADAEAVDEYWCDPHRGIGMVGALGLGADPAAAAGGGGGFQFPSFSEALSEEPPARVMYGISAVIVAGVLAIMVLAAGRR